MKENEYIIVTGLSGAGKSSFCKLLAEESNLRVINAGDAIKDYLNKLNLQAPYRENIGDLFLSRFCEEDICKVLIDFAKQHGAHIIDGLRLYPTFKEFQRNSSFPVLVFIEVSAGIRKRRLEERSSLNKTAEIKATLNRRDNYYLDIMLLKTHANFIVSNDGPIDKLSMAAKIIWRNIQDMPKPF